MTRTTEQASAIHVLVVGLDGKTKTVYEVFPPMAAFADIANTLDHARNSGLESVAEREAKSTTAAPAKHRQVAKV